MSGLARPDLTPPEEVLVAFGSGTADLQPTLIEKLREIEPHLPLYVISEFQPPEGTWIVYNYARRWWHNLARYRDLFRHKRVKYVAMLLQPRQPYWPMRLIAVLMGLHRTLVYNENLDHFRIHPSSLPTMLAHARWRLRNSLRWHFRPGGWIYTQVWRLRHPRAYRRPVKHFLTLAAGWLAMQRKRFGARAVEPPAAAPLEEGISVVVPSRSGKELLARLLPGLTGELAGLTAEVIVVDNGSDDGTAAWLAREYPPVRVEVSLAPLSFAAAVNRGIALARYSHTCLLNNDMVLEAGFFPPLRAAFDEVPELFCSTAQIFFPAGRRREETGKAVFAYDADADALPLRCDLPVPGETHSYVLYGSGGCSLYDTVKLRRLGGVDEAYTPAYVEDLDLAYRAWLRGWATVFVSDAKLLHLHRSTTRKHYSKSELLLAVERNYARFLARAVADPAVFWRMWRRAAYRMNLLAAREPPVRFAHQMLWEMIGVPARVRPGFHAEVYPEAMIHSLGSGQIAVFPGHAGRAKPVVLIASAYLPYPLSHGGAVRMYNLMRRAAADYDQVLVAFAEELAPVPPELLAICREVVVVRRERTHARPLGERPLVVEEFDAPAFHAALAATIRKHRPELAQLEFTQMGLYARSCAGLPTLLVEHDITLDLYTQLVAHGGDWETRQQAPRWQRFERALWREVSCVVTMSEKDSAMVEGARRVETLANGVDLERYRPAAVEPEPGRLLFIGSFAHLPNVMAVAFFLREVWPRLAGLGARLHLIAGARPEHYLEMYRERVQLDLRVPGVEVEHFVSDVRPAYERAAVVIAPLLASAGTNIKILEAMAMGKAIVTTPAGINGLALGKDGEVVVAESGEQMAARLRELLEDPARRRAVETAARRRAEAEYGWDAVAARQRALYESLRTGRSDRAATVRERA
jgi:GT2 family glycosyltransferase